MYTDGPVRAELPRNEYSAQMIKIAFFFQFGHCNQPLLVSSSIKETNQALSGMNAYLERIIRILRWHWIQCLPIASGLALPGVQINCAGNIELASMAMRNQMISAGLLLEMTWDPMKLTCELST